MQLADYIQAEWEAFWAKTDYCRRLVLLHGGNRTTIKRVAAAVGRSGQCIERWAALATFFPADRRRLDRSPQEHYRVMRGGEWKDGGPRQ